MSAEHTPQDIELLSAYLDGELSDSERIALEQRLDTDPALQAELASLRQTVTLINQLPPRKAPRDFTLPRSAGNVLPFTLTVGFSFLSTAAAVLLFAFGGYFLLNAGTPLPILNQSLVAAEQVTLRQQTAVAAAPEVSAPGALADALPTATELPSPSPAPPTPSPAPTQPPPDSAGGESAGAANLAIQAPADEEAESPQAESDGADLDDNLEAQEGMFRSEDRQSQTATGDFFAFATSPAPAVVLQSTETAQIIPHTPTTAAQALDAVEPGETLQNEPVELPPAPVNKVQPVPDNLVLGTVLVVVSALLLLVALATTFVRRRRLRS